ncbi:B3 domain-containing protein Os04g0386900-like [Abrus precatorius]|uniref:B3 domain-containing protein Os04g0386900-like n=1 Tax=Abrus precatorius TaxID=3816 RepID=A0A8B8KY44_ABRPR|nr:B3 domain-containing protein Os04g0386900-like [Abrus precatorius]
MLPRRSSRRVGSFTAEVENGAPLPPPNPTTNLQGDEVKPLSGKPYCLMILSKTNLSPRYAMGPSTSIKLKLPSTMVRTVLTYKGKSWDMVYNGHRKGWKLFAAKGWKKFAVDNCLKIGDACILELMESRNKKIIFNVQILRGDIPSKFLENDTMGQTAEMAIVID